MRRVRKLIGVILFYGLARFLPAHTCWIKPVGKLSKKIRALSGKLMLEQCGSNVNICKLSKFSTKTKIGNNSGIGYKANITGTCTIGNNVIMGPEVTIFTINHNTDNIDIPIKYQGDAKEKPVYIGDDSWIGYRSIILPGVKIGKGVVIGAGAVVAKDVPDYAVAVGNPARIVKYRYDELGGKTINDKE